ncbi:MAG: tetratricopeptide repeat protein, partial [Rubrivivax sp.]|nr:tetratricopeptide repeat protein [Rubrivivax sp.]
LAQRRLDAAELLLRDAIRSDPRRADAHLLLAKVLLSMNAPLPATASLRRHLRLFPDNPEALALMAQLLLQQRRFAEAAEMGRRLAAVRPRDPAVWGGLATCYEQLHRPDDAAGAWRRVYQLASDQRMILGAAEWLARYHHGRQEFATAAGYLRRIISLKPVLVPPRRQLVSCLFQTGDWLGVAAAVRGLVALQPADLPLRMQWIEALVNAGELNLARDAVDRTLRELDRPGLPQQLIGLLMARGQAGLAIGLLEQWRRREPRRYEYAAMLADVHQATGQPARARELLLGLLRELPQDAGLRARLGQLAFVAYDWQDVVRLLEPLLRSGQPYPPPLLVPLAYSYERLGRCRDAAMAYTKLAELAREPAILLRAARMHRRLGELPQAQAACEQVLAAVPRHLPTLVELAGVLAEQNRLDEALERLHEALRIDPSDPSAGRELVAVHRARGDLAAAAEACRKLAALDPDNDLALLELGDLAWSAGHRDEAFGIWQQAVADHPGSAALHARLAQAYEAVADNPRAVAAYEAAARRAGTDVASRMALLRLSEAAGNASAARR